MCPRLVKWLSVNYYTFIHIPAFKRPGRLDSLVINLRGQSQSEPTLILQLFAGLFYKNILEGKLARVVN